MTGNAIISLIEDHNTIPNPYSRRAVPSSFSRSRFRNDRIYGIAITRNEDKQIIVSRSEVGTNGINIWVSFQIDDPPEGENPIGPRSIRIVLGSVSYTHLTLPTICSV